MTALRTIRALPASVAALLVALASLAVLVPGAGADTEDGSAAVGPISVTKVDATGDTVEAAISGFVTGVEPEMVSVSTRGDSLDVVGVSTSRAENRPLELVVIVDTNARALAGDVLTRITDQLADDVAALPADTTVSVISAGNNALIEQRPTTDRAKAAEALRGLKAKNGSALFTAVDRAGGLLTDEPGVTRTVLIVSTGVDTGSAVTLDEAQVALVQAGAQVVSVRYDGGESRLARATDRSAGVDLVIDGDDQVESVMANAMDLATNRLLVSFAGTAEAGTRTNVDLTIGSSTTKFSYPAGALSDGPLQLAPLSLPEPSGIAFFRSSVGLYIALGLAFVGISLGIWSLASIMAGGDANLDGVLSRYTDGSLDLGDDDEVGELIVQSALLQRAVTFSESFAEKRGFLARVEELLERANLPVRAGEGMFILAAIAVLSSGLGLVLTQSILVALLFGVGATGIAFFVVRFLGRRRFKAFESQLPDTLQLLAGTLRAGYSLPQGFEVVSKEIADPMGQELRRAMTEARLGRELEESLSGVSERMASADFAWAVMAIGIQREVGGNLNELLMSVADTMIARERLKREIGALTAEGRMSAGVLSFLPPGLGFVMWIMNPEYVGLLFSEFLGNVLLGTGVVSALIGLAWMKKVITVDV